MEIINNTTPKISIIANLYKSERYITKLIKSVLNQTYTNWELLCINDCSPGKDAQIVEKFISHPKANGRIKLINNSKNLGIAKAKKIGIENALGEYITFIDGDDWFASKALEMLITPAIKYDLDLVIMNNYKIIPYLNYKWKIRSNISHDIYNKPLYHPNIFDKYYINFFGINIFATNSYWGKLYKLNTLVNSKIEHPSNDTYEDNIFNFRLFPHIKSMMFIDYFGYYWRWGGITSGKKSEIYDEYRFIDFMAEFYIERINAIQKYDYTKAHMWLLIEMKNVLKSNISNIAKFDLYSSNIIPIKEKIKAILNYKAYDDMKLLHSLYPKSVSDVFVNAIIDKDVDAIYNYCNTIYKSKRTQFFLKQLLYKFVNTLSFLKN